MVVVVPGAILESSRRARGLNAPDQSLSSHEAERVVHGLQRNGSNLRPYGIGHGVGRDMRLTRDSPQNRESLGRHLDAAITEEIGRIDGHSGEIKSNIGVIQIF